MSTAEVIHTIDNLNETELRNRLADIEGERSAIIFLLRAKRSRNRRVTKLNSGNAAINPSGGGNKPAGRNNVPKKKTG